MSGSGGFYKYRCKYFYTHNCQEWVWVNGAACASCLAEGREEESYSSMPTWRLSREIYVPQVYDGALQYTLMEIVATGESGQHWFLQQKSSQPLIPTTMTTNATPGAVTATAGIKH